LALGAALGGIIGKQLFSWIRNSSGDPRFLGGIQSLCLAAVTLMTLILMICGGIGGGIAGRAVSKRIKDSTVDKLFVVLIAIIILISLYNAWNYF